MNRELLETPFAPDQIRQRKGNFGQVLDYVEAHAVIQRLNDALDGAWSFEVIEHQVLKEQNEVLVLGKLSTATGIVKSQFGSSAITRAQQTGEIISLADDLKAAATDCLKKCASLLGVGLHLYGGARQPATHDKVTPIRGKDSREDDKGRLSAKQHKFVISLAQNRGMTRKELDEHCISAYGAGVDFITRKDASNLIEALRSGQGPAGRAEPGLVASRAATR
jgi:hypothetical protein